MAELLLILIPFLFAAVGVAALKYSGKIMVRLANEDKFDKRTSNDVIWFLYFAFWVVIIVPSPFSAWVWESIRAIAALCSAPFQNALKT